jgi:hypothetical protein
MGFDFNIKLLFSIANGENFKIVFFQFSKLNLIYFKLSFATVMKTWKNSITSKLQLQKVQFQL